jgi:hypothetical protein
MTSLTPLQQQHAAVDRRRQAQADQRGARRHAQRDVRACAAAERGGRLPAGLRACAAPGGGRVGGRTRPSGRPGRGSPRSPAAAVVVARPGRCGRRTFTMRGRPCGASAATSSRACAPRARRGAGRRRRRACRFRPRSPAILRAAPRAPGRRRSRRLSELGHAVGLRFTGGRLEGAARGGGRPAGPRCGPSRLSRTRPGRWARRRAARPAGTPSSQARPRLTLPGATPGSAAKRLRCTRKPVRTPGRVLGASTWPPLAGCGGRRGCAGCCRSITSVACRRRSRRRRRSGCRDQHAAGASGAAGAAARQQRVLVAQQAHIVELDAVAPSSAPRPARRRRRRRRVAGRRTSSIASLATVRWRSCTSSLAMTTWRCPRCRAWRAPRWGGRGARAPRGAWAGRCSAAHDAHGAASAGSPRAARRLVAHAGPFAVGAGAELDDRAREAAALAPARRRAPPAACGACRCRRRPPRSRRAAAACPAARPAPRVGALVPGSAASASAAGGPPRRWQGRPDQARGQRAPCPRPPTPRASAACRGCTRRGSCGAIHAARFMRRPLRNLHQVQRRLAVAVGAEQHLPLVGRERRVRVRDLAVALVDTPAAVVPGERPRWCRPSGRTGAGRGRPASWHWRRRCRRRRPACRSRRPRSGVPSWLLIRCEHGGIVVRGGLPASPGRGCGSSVRAGP